MNLRQISLFSILLIMDTIGFSGEIVTIHAVVTPIEVSGKRTILAFVTLMESDAMKDVRR